MNIINNHECDLFLMSSHHQYMADNILKSFAIQGKRNIDGWGVGAYNNREAICVKSSEQAYNNTKSISSEYAIALNSICSPIILGHLRLTSQGDTRKENNHPFKLSFLGYDWLFIHNGTSCRHNEMISPDEMLLIHSNSDSPRIFEYLRKHIIQYYYSSSKKSLIEACRISYQSLLEFDPRGGFNIILSNGYLSFVFIHFRSFYLLHREKDQGDVAIISTMDLSDEDWIEFKITQKKKAKMLVFNGNSLIFNGDIPK